MRKETRCCHIGHSFRLTARVLLYVPSHRQDSMPVMEHWLERELAQSWRIDPSNANDPECLNFNTPFTMNEFIRALK